jgi:hypothetical protein
MLVVGPRQEEINHDNTHDTTKAIRDPKDDQIP